MPGPELVISSVNKSFGRFQALRNVSLTVSSGSTTLILGPNGAGKTTLLRCVMGLLNFKGSVRYGDLDVRSEGTKVRAMIGYVPQQSAYYENLTVLAEISMMSKLKHTDHSEVESLLRSFNLWEHRRKKVRSLSSGMRQRLGVTVALLGDPTLLIFDEPMSNLDVRNQTEFQTILDELSSEGKTMVIATHLSGLDKRADKAIVMDAGRVIADDAPSNLLRKIGTSSRITIRPKESEFERVRALVGTLNVKEVVPNAPWISFLAPGESKASVFKAINDSGYMLDDMIVEASSIESEYLKLIGGENAH